MQAQLPQLPFSIVAHGRWLIHHGGCFSPWGGIRGQLTKCRLDGITFYVRENFAVAHFYIHSGVRQGMKRGQLPSGAVDVLELCAPRVHWSRLAELVETVDRLHGFGRRVRANRRFTPAWAERALADARRGSS